MPDLDRNGRFTQTVGEQPNGDLMGECAVHPNTVPYVWHSQGG